MQPAEGSSEQSLQRSLPALLSQSISNQPAQFSRLTSTKSASHCDTTSACTNKADSDEKEEKRERARQEKKPAPVLHSLHPSPTTPSTHHVGRLERLETSSKQQKRESRASTGMVKGKLGHSQPAVRKGPASFLLLVVRMGAPSRYPDSSTNKWSQRVQTMRSDVSDARPWIGSACPATLVRLFLLTFIGLSAWYRMYSTTFLSTLLLTLSRGMSSASLSPSAIV